MKSNGTINVFELAARSATLQAARLLDAAGTNDRASAIFETMGIYASAQMIAEQLLTAQSTHDRIRGDARAYSQGHIDREEACRRLAEAIEHVAESAALVCTGIEAQGSKEFESERTNVGLPFNRSAIDRLTQLLAEAREVVTHLIVQSEVGDE